MTIETTPIRVREGDDLTHIVRAHGFRDRDWRRIYEASYNRAFRRRNPDPNLIMPGEDFRIPTHSPRRLRDIQGKIDRAEARLTRLRRELGAFRDMLRSEAREIERREGTVDRARAARDRARVMRRRINAMEELISEASGECEDEYTCAGAGAAIEGLRGQINEMEREVDRLERIEQQERPVDRSTFDPLQRRVTALEREVGREQTRLNGLRRDLRRTEQRLFR